MKRLFDIVVAVVAIVVFSIPLVVVAVFVWLTLGKPIFFRQARPGMGGKPFLLVKFRTMLDVHDNEGKLLADSERLTQFGRFLRASSLDELPELWNVLKGDMSIVGPRPLLLEYLPLYTNHQFRRHEVRPGITGWAQVNGRNALSWEERFDLDVWYVDNQSLWLDMKILWMTVLTVLRREGISQKGHVTMEKFKGSDHG